MSIRTRTRYCRSSNTWPGPPVIQTNQATDPATNDRRDKSTESKPSKPPTPAPIPITPSNPLLPDLSRVATAAYTASILAHPPPPTNYGRPGTRPFSLDPLPFTDADVPLPKPYNSKYPHPITAYASPGVNPETVKRSGYDEMLQNIVKKDVKDALGDIFYDAGFRNLSNSVYLLFSYESMGQGNGIPESLWSKFENVNNVRLPTVATVASSVAAQVEDIPRRFAPSQINSTCKGDVNPHCSMENNQVMERAFRSLSRESISSPSCMQVQTQPLMQPRGEGEMDAWKTDIWKASEATERCRYRPSCQARLKLTRESLMLRGLASQSPTPDILSPTSSHRSSFSQYPVTPRSVQTQIYAQEITAGYPYNVKANDRRMSAPLSQLGMVAEDELQFGTFNSDLNLGYRRQSDVSSGFSFAYSQDLRAPSSRRHFDLVSPKFTPSPDEEYKDCLLPLSKPKQPSSDFAAISVMSFNRDSLSAKEIQRRLVPQPSNLTLYTSSSSSSNESVGGGSRLSLFSAFEDGLSESLITPTDVGWENNYLGSTCSVSNFKFGVDIRSSNRGIEDEIGFGAIGMRKGGLVKSGSMDSVNTMESPAHSSLSSMVRSKGSTTYEFSSGSSIWS
ncbi:hypothetical protein D1P53_000101 [Cryptococcus gattii VGV]|nr:hypothetical protein D1P53_000101 [Cryptococcus gattii VGV]